MYKKSCRSRVANNENSGHDQISSRKKTLKCPEKFTNNHEYVNCYVEMLYMSAVVGSMNELAARTDMEDIFLSSNYHSEYYSDFGADTKKDFLIKLKKLKAEYSEYRNFFHAALKNSDCSIFPMERMVSEYHLSRDEADIVMLAFAIAHNSKFEGLSCLSAVNYSYCNSVNAVLITLGHTEQHRLDLKSHFRRSSRIVQNGLIMLYGRCNSENDFGDQHIEISRRISAQIQDISEPDDTILAFSKLVTPVENMSMVVYDENKKQEVLNLIRNRTVFQQNRIKWGLDKLINYGYGTTILFSGKPGTGKSMMVNAIAKELNMRLLQVDVPALFKSSNRDAEDNFKLIMREASLQNDVILSFEEADELFSGDRSNNRMIPTVLREFEQFNGVCILSTNQKQLLDEALDRRILLKLDFELPDYSARKAIWEHLLPPTLPLADDVDCAELAIKFAFSGGYIKNAVIMACQRMADKNSDNVRITQQDLIDAAQSQRTGQLERLSDRVKSSIRLKDVVLTDEQKAIIEDIIFEMRNKERVFNDFNFKQIIPYGRATIALFYGPSGSGKTMTAEAIASELGLNLLNISPAHLVSKYVGQSSRNIAELFKTAAEEEAMLLFDECESLFAARSDSSSNPALDRDNNQQINQLLRSIERFDGLVIMTSNRIDNMDSAFARRIRHHVCFEAPAPAVRSKIWRKHFPQEIPLTEDVDFEKLSAEYDFSGGTIKQIALKAAFCAVRRNCPVSMKILQELCTRETDCNKVGGRKKIAAVGFAS